MPVWYDWCSLSIYRVYSFILPRIFADVSSTTWRQGDNCSYPMGPYMPSAPSTPQKTQHAKEMVHGWFFSQVIHADQTIIFPYGSVSKWRFTLLLSDSPLFSHSPHLERTSWMVAVNKIHCCSVAVGTRLTRPYSYHLTPVVGWCCVIVNLMQQRSWRHQRSCVHCSAGSILWEFCHQAERWKLKRMPLAFAKKKMGVFFWFTSGRFWKWLVKAYVFDCFCYMVI